MEKKESRRSPPRTVDTYKQLEELILDITTRDLNRQIQHLITEYKRTGDDKYKTDAEYLRSEFNSWWDAEECEFVPPAEV